MNTKTIMGVIFNLQNSYSLTFSLPREEACGKASSCRFSSSAARNAITKAIEYITFGFPFRILVVSAFKESLNVAVSDTDFSVFKQL